MADVHPKDELAEEPSDYGTLKPGTRLGRYELLVPVARGGMARVWAARLQGQRGFSKLVAIKTILPQLANEPEFERMFLDEARIASGVHHPNVCEIYELGEDERTLYLAMEWVNGDSLSRVLRASGHTEAIEPRVVARVVADACAGVHAAHELADEDGTALNVVHRDLSPHNILITADGTSKVADFGVAKALGQLHEATSAGQLKGKISYMSPEQVTGTVVDRRSDVFALGCVLYEATTGTRPFRGEGDHQIMHAILKGEIVPPTKIAKGYPQELERIVLRALSSVPLLRFPTAERMRFALEEFLAKGPLVTQANVGQMMRARIQDVLDKRKERIRQASTAGDRDGWSEPPAAALTPSKEFETHRSGVQHAGVPPQEAGRGTLASPVVSALRTPAMGAAAAVIRDPAHGSMSATVPQGHPPSAATIPQAPKAKTTGRPAPPDNLAQTSTLAIAGADFSSVGSAAPDPVHPSATVPHGSSPDLGQVGTLLMDQPAVDNLLATAGATAGMSANPTSSSNPNANMNLSTVSVDLSPPTGPGIGQYVFAAVMGLVVAAVIGTAAFFLWRSQNRPMDEPILKPGHMSAPPQAPAPPSRAP